MAHLKQCCASGSLHTGTPTGSIQKIHGLDSYVAEAPTGNPKGIVVIIPDAFGIALPNNRILADEYAKNGNFKVILPDFMDGHVLPADLMISLEALTAPGFWNQFYKLVHLLYLLRYVPWFLWSVRASVSGPRIFAFLKTLRETGDGPHLPVGVAGFCWGGLWVTRLCWNEERTASGKRLVDVGYVAHPSMLTYPADIEKIVLPYSCAACEHDGQMPPQAARQTKETLAALSAKQKDGGIEHEFVMYEGAHHGFAVRANEDDKEEAARGKRAEEQAVSWFSRWFANPPP